MISVIMPAYNCKAYIAQAVRSALRQDVHEDLEVIVIDDASGDGTGEAVEAFLARQAECGEARSVICHRNPVNLGAAESRNVGLHMAHGEYVAFLDADDWWEEGKLTKQLHLMREKDALLVYSGRELMREDGSPLGKVISVPGHTTYQKLLRTNCIPCSSVLMKTDIAREFCFRHDELHEDYILWLEFLKKYKIAYGVNEPLLKSRMAAGGKSRNKAKSAKMQYGVYLHMGIPAWRAAYLFLCYAVNGVKKYW